MKQTLKTLLALMAGTMALAACSDDAIIENIIPHESKLVPMTFTAHQENEGETRATIDGTSIQWSEGDKISIFDGSNTNCGNQCFTLSSEAGATSGEFEGEAAPDASTYYALYPYAATTSSKVTDQDCLDAGIGESDLNRFKKVWDRSGDERVSSDMQSKFTSSQIELVLDYLNGRSVTKGPQLSEGNITNVVMPAVQTIATGEHVDASAMLMMAQSTEGTNDLKFKNVVSYFKFTAPFDCSKVQIFDNASAGQMAGTVKLAYNGGEPTATVTVNGASSITLTGAIAGGETYYIATLPQTFTEGITMSFVKSDDTEYVKRTSSSYQLGRNKVSNMGAPEPSLINPPYVTFSATSSQTLSMNKSVEGLEYSVGGGAWTALGTSTVTFGGSGNDLRLRGTNGWGTAKDDTGNYGIVSFVNETKVACSGDIRTLVDYRNYENVNTTNARFCKLFRGCSQLTSAPLLPATQLATYCYDLMFEGCTSLATAPALPAEVLANYCYHAMFLGCTSLTTTPALAAESLAEGCYYAMFYGCTSLTTAQALPATTLVDECYDMMFYNCKNLEKAPYLPATQLAPNCYVQMFSGCSKLNYVKAAFTTTPGNSYTRDWLDGVAATGTFVKSHAATWDVTGASGVPSGWTVEVSYGPNVAWESALTLGKSEATSIVLEVGVATKPAGAHNLNSEGTLWEVLDGTTLKIQSSQGKIIGSYNPIEKGGLFQGYSKAETITGLDKLATEDMTTMARMFLNCKALTGLNLATFNTAKVEDMWQMFYGCEKLTSLDLSTFNIRKVGDVQRLFCDCKTLTSLTVGSDFVLPAATVTEATSTEMFMLNPDGDKNNYKGMCTIYGATEEVKASLKQLHISQLYYVKFDGE